MPAPSREQIELLREQWTDQMVKIVPGHPEFDRFASRVGRVVTVNWSGKAVVDFADGAWYDVPASEKYLTKLPNDDPDLGKFDPKATSAQGKPTRQS